MDILFIICWIISFIIYIILQAVLLRVTNHLSNAAWQLKLSLIFPLVCVLCIVLIFRWFSIPFLLTVFAGSMMGFMIFVTEVIYIVMIYSNLESSITLRFLSFIVQKPYCRIGMRQFLSEYTTEKIIIERIERFLAMNMIRKENNKYEHISAISPFSIRSIIEKIFSFFFPVIGNQTK
jgi:hypothetical protein